MKNYRRMGGTVNAETPEILLEMEKILVTKIRLWTISDIQPSSFLSYALNKRNPHRMKTLRLLSLVSQNGNEKSSKWTTQRWGIGWAKSFQWSAFCIFFSWRVMAVHLQTSPSQTSWLLKSVSILRWWSFSHSLTLLAQIPQLGGKIFKLSRNNIPSANPAVPLASVLRLIGFTTLESGCFHSSWRRW